MRKKILPKRTNIKKIKIWVRGGEAGETPVPLAALLKSVQYCVWCSPITTGCIR